MLDSVTKKRIDDLRNILVGKIPSPQSQVEQITTGLIYKFMYDMDEEAVEMGGVPSFFTGDYEKYSWKHLFDPKIGGAEKVQLYSEAIEEMYTNPTAPPLFREIFKNSFLPFKDPATLNMFLKEINEFHYSHSEKLGDAFEYLLSFMGSQGDAGQFRTPRHIIDFIVKIVNPQKNETILDPACGTAGFLISSYKHILSQNTDKKVGDKLSATERKEVGDNLVGYDISPDMTRISLVNMYLHQFASPQIHEYDTLSSEDRWNEYYDVILANPPFFSPKGGVIPHSRFSVESKRAEILFLNYIIEHLVPSGRAAIVVPDGVITKKENVYKSLRKRLIEDNYLIGVVSLPKGIFLPYSPVKTSILFIDRERSRNESKIFFGNVKSDGYSLGAKREKIGQSDLPKIQDGITEGTDNPTLKWINKDQINDETYSLNFIDDGGNERVSSEYPMVAIGEICEIAPPKRQVKHLADDTEVSFLPMEDVVENSKSIFPNKKKTIGSVYGGYTYFEDGDILVAKVTPCFENGKIGIVSDCENGIGFGSTEFIVLRCKDKVLPEYLYHFVSSDEFVSKGVNNFTGTSGLRRVPKEFVRDFKIPLPSIEVQKQMVEEIEGYYLEISDMNQSIRNLENSIKQIIAETW